MLNGDDNENGSTSKDLISQKTNCTCSTLFFLISKKTNLHVQHAFCLSLPLFCITTTLFCRTKTSNFLVTHYLYGGIVVCAYPIFCLLCSCLLLFFAAAHFHLAGRQRFSLSHSRFEFSCFSSNKIRLFCFQSLALALSLSFKNNVEKDTTLLLFFLSKSLGGHAISFQMKP